MLSSKCLAYTKKATARNAAYSRLRHKLCDFCASAARFYTTVKRLIISFEVQVLPFYYFSREYTLDVLYGIGLHAYNSSSYYHHEDMLRAANLSLSVVCSNNCT